MATPVAQATASSVGSRQAERGDWAEQDGGAYDVAQEAVPQPTRMPAQATRRIAPVVAQRSQAEPRDWTPGERLILRTAGTCAIVGVLSWILPFFGLQFRKLAAMGDAAPIAGAVLVLVGGLMAGSVWLRRSVPGLGKVVRWGVTGIVGLLVVVVVLGVVFDWLRHSGSSSFTPTAVAPAPIPPPTRTVPRRPAPTRRTEPVTRPAPRVPPGPTISSPDQVMRPQPGMEPNPIGSGQGTGATTMVSAPVVQRSEQSVTPAAPEPSSARRAGLVGQKPGDRVEINVEDRWLPGQVVKVEGRRALVHFDGREDAADEWVAGNRIRSVGE